MSKIGAYFFGLTLRSKVLDWYPAFQPLFKFTPVWLLPLAREAAMHFSEEETHFGKLYSDAISTLDGRAQMPSFAADIAASQTRGNERQMANCSQIKRLLLRLGLRLRQVLIQRRTH